MADSFNHNTLEISFPLQKMQHIKKNVKHKKVSTEFKKKKHVYEKSYVTFMLRLF